MIDEEKTSTREGEASCYGGNSQVAELRTVG
ncbi:MAG: hypothetical protein QG609_531 [Patescibacteria group bacterium]|nr:hypothetical protein [Patescibacteria group bacterium]